MSQHTPGPCETLARLAIQSDRYREDADFRDAVDGVLGRPVYDAAPAMREALEAFFDAYKAHPERLGTSSMALQHFEAARALLKAIDG